MIQKTMFDNANLHRKTDPGTSVEAAQDLVESGKLNLSQERLLQSIKVMHAVTAQEAAMRCVAMHGGLQETYRKRAGELCTLGLIAQVGTRKCRVTGKSAAVFEATRCGRRA